MDKADEERLIHAAGSQLWSQAAQRTTLSTNKPNPHFREEKHTKLCHGESSSSPHL